MVVFVDAYRPVEAVIALAAAASMSNHVRAPVPVGNTDAVRTRHRLASQPRASNDDSAATGNVKSCSTP